MKSRFLFILLVTITTMSCTSQTTTYESVDSVKFADILLLDNIQIVDVRTPEEFYQGHIQGAICMDMRNPNFDDQIKQLDTNRPVAMYCRAGRRSKIAAEKMSAIGLIVYELDRGIISWRGELVR
jgi:rhodanese-related sulfurtransferase